jgi:hypothetical protein
VLLGLDLAFRGEARTQERGAYHISQLGLRQQHEIVVAAPPDAKRRDEPGLRRQQQGIEHARLRDVVREHALKELLGAGTLDADERARPPGGFVRNSCHRN